MTLILSGGLLTFLANLALCVPRGRPGFDSRTMQNYILNFSLLHVQYTEVNGLLESDFSIFLVYMQVHTKYVWPRLVTKVGYCSWHFRFMDKVKFFFRAAALPNFRYKLWIYTNIPIHELTLFSRSLSSYWPKPSSCDISPGRQEHNRRINRSKSSSQTFHWETCCSPG